jgi:hypothetical protein
MTATDNAHKATGKSPHEDFDFKAVTGDKKNMGAHLGLRHQQLESPGDV